MTAHILLVGDEPALPARLAAAGYRVTMAPDSRAAIGSARRAAPDVVLLDLERLGMDGRAIVQAIRMESDAPMILLSARGREAEKVAALEEGADDYVDAPFEDGELITRLRLAEWRRLRHRPAGPDGFTAGRLFIDFAARRVSVDGRRIRLSPKEYALLRLLARSAGAVVEHRALLAAGWGPSATDTQYLRVYVGMLRQKIEEDPADPRLILTEPGIGYRLAVPVN